MELVVRFRGRLSPLIVVNIIVIFAFPEQASWFESGSAWRIFLHKNALGQVAAFANLVFLIRLANFRSETWAARAYHAVFCALSVILVLGSDSAAALMLLVVNLAVLLGALLIIQWADRLKPVHWLGVGVLGIAALAATWWQRHLIVVVILGKTPTLTGRIPLWLSLVPHIEKKLVLGYGFGNAFWVHKDNVRQVMEKVRWFPGHAHNGFLDILLSLGLLGALAYAAFIIETFLLSVWYLSRARTVTSALPFMMVCYAVAANLAASTLTSVQLLAWPALVAAWAICMRALIVAPHQNTAPEVSGANLAGDALAAQGRG
jgi:O-antigen ligase